MWQMALGAGDSERREGPFRGSGGLGKKAACEAVALSYMPACGGE